MQATKAMQGKFLCFVWYIFFFSSLNLQREIPDEPDMFFCIVLYSFGENMWYI